MRPCDLYRAFDDNGVLLYVGVSYICEARLRNHALVSDWFKRAKKFDVMRYPDRQSALAAERKAITTENPLCNRYRPKIQKQLPPHYQLGSSHELRDLIAAAGMSQAQAAAALGKTQRMVEYWLSGEHEPPKMAILAMRWIAQETRKAS